MPHKTTDTGAPVKRGGINQQDRITDGIEVSSLFLCTNGITHSVCHLPDRVPDRALRSCCGFRGVNLSAVGAPHAQPLLVPTLFPELKLTPTLHRQFVLPKLPVPPESSSVLLVFARFKKGDMKCQLPTLPQKATWYMYLEHN